MPKIKVIQTKGTLVLNQINFNEVCEAVVKPGNENCGRIYLPKEWIGKKVFVILKPGG